MKGLTIEKLKAANAILDSADDGEFDPAACVVVLFLDGRWQILMPAGPRYFRDDQGRKITLQFPADN
jgi:hypothetical protein